MSEQSYIFIAGIVIAVVAYFSKNFVFDQLLAYRKTVGRIRNRLRYHAGIITNDEFPVEITKPITAELRQLSCDLDENYYAVPFVSKLYWLYRLPKQDNLDDAARRLIYLSNSTGNKNSVEGNHKAMEEIERLLRIRVVSS